DPVVLVAGLQRRPPRLASIGRCAHELKVAERVVVELGVAAPVEGAARSGVAHRPVLVVEVTIRVDGDWPRPGQSPVGGPADEDVHMSAAERAQAEVGDQPNSVLRIEGDGRVAGGGVWSGWCRAYGSRGQDALRPIRPTVVGGGEADVSPATVEDA